MRMSWHIRILIASGKTGLISDRGRFNLSKPPQCLDVARPDLILMAYSMYYPKPWTWLTKCSDTQVMCAELIIYMITTTCILDSQLQKASSWAFAGAPRLANSATIFTLQGGTQEGWNQRGRILHMPSLPLACCSFVGKVSGGEGPQRREYDPADFSVLRAPVSRQKWSGVFNSLCTRGNFIEISYLDVTTR